MSEPPSRPGTEMRVPPQWDQQRGGCYAVCHLSCRLNGSHAESIGHEKHEVREPDAHLSHRRTHSTTEGIYWFASTDEATYSQNAGIWILRHSALSPVDAAMTGMLLLQI